MKECNLGVDTHNAITSHHSQENRTTQIILLVSILLNFLLILVFVLRKPISKACRERTARRRQQKKDRQQQTARRQAAQTYAALQEFMDRHPDHITTLSHSIERSPPPLATLIFKPETKSAPPPFTS